MKAERFEDLICWQKGKDLAVKVYKCFKMNRDFGFKDQIQRAVVSVSNNIAEGFERRSNKEFTQFLYIAKGSSGEVRSMLQIALELEYISKEQFNNFFNDCLEISKITAGLIKTL
jgi:four helix bundle protein